MNLIKFGITISVWLIVWYSVSSIIWFFLGETQNVMLRADGAMEYLMFFIILKELEKIKK